MARYLKTSFMRDLEIQVIKEKISYGRMLELIQEEVIKNYHILNLNILLKNKNNL